MEHLKKPMRRFSSLQFLITRLHSAMTRTREREVLFEMDIGVLKLALAWSQLLNSTLSSDFRKTSHKHLQDFFSDV